MIVLPEVAWDTLLDLLTEGAAGHEHVVYLDGVRVDGTQVVTTVTVPDADTSPGSYTVPAEAMSRAGEHLRHLGLVRIAQVHTHPGHGVDHSPRDDRMTYSQRTGAVSLVVPGHAHSRPTATDPSVGVHVRRALGWIRLDPAEAAALVQVVPSVIDHRSHRCDHERESPTATADRQPVWSRWIRAALSRFTSN